MKIYILKQQLSSLSYVVSSILVGLIYLLTLIFLLDTKIFLNILSLPMNSWEKLDIIFLTSVNSLTQLPRTELLLFLLISVLVGLNISLLWQKIDVLKKRKMKLTFSAGIISLVGAGCAACGVSLVSVLGIGAAAAILPFKGMELSILALLVLLTTFYYSISSLAVVCDIPSTSGKKHKRKYSSR